MESFLCGIKFDVLRFFSPVQFGWLKRAIAYTEWVRRVCVNDHKVRERKSNLNEPNGCEMRTNNSFIIEVDRVWICVCAVTKVLDTKTSHLAW